ncbi:hypothetical protein ACFPJ4_02730 [Lysinimonas soli]|uniref:FUSC family protein n=1 Tax=Lysinimonas soli TaxID=1074233 RepID=A0ABW0NLG6_9MICO
MTFSAPEENTLGVVVGNARRAMGKTARRLGRASAHRASLGTAFLALGAAILVGLRAVYGLSWFVALWNVYPQPLAALAAWIVLGAVIVGAILTSRMIGDRLPDWMFGLFLTGLLVAVALDVIAIWNLHDIGRNATAALAAGMTLLVVVTLRGSVELLTAAGVLGLGLAVLMFLDTPPSDQLTSDWIAPQITAIAAAVLPAVIGVVIVESFRRMVQVELDRVLVQSTVSAPRYAVGMLASEELARLDLAAEELLESIAKKKTPLPLAPKMASIAASLATELRLHLIEGRRETWLYHAVSESEMLGKAVTLIDKSSLAGLLDPVQRDGLLAAAWLLVGDTVTSNASRTVTVQLGPVEPGTEAVPERKILIPITITTTGVARNRVDPSIWDALGRVGHYSDQTQDSSLRVDIECLVDNPADV